MQPGVASAVRRGLGSWLVAVAGYVAVTVVLHRQLLADPVHRLPGGAQGPAGDPILFAWFLRWVPFALVHGHDPFLTDYLFYPTGVNVAWNTAVPALGVLLAPVTLTAGPVLSVNLALVAAPVLTAWSARWWLVRHVRPAVAGLGGLLVGFGPFVNGQGLGHLHLVFLPLVPIVLRLLEDALWRRPRPARGTALLMGVAAGAQLYVGEEILVITAVGVLLVLVWSAVLRPRRTARAVRAAAGTLAVAVVVSALVGLPLLAVQLFGPDRISRVGGGGFAAVPADLVSPTTRELLGPATDGRLAARGLNPYEATSYLGWPLLLVLAAVLVWRRRDPAARVAALCAASAVVLSLGARLPGRSAVPLPWDLLGRVPGLDSVLPVRFSLVGWLAAVWLLCAGLDRWWAARRGAPRLAGLAAVGLALVPLLPRAYSATTFAVPRLFTGAAVDVIPAGSPVLLLPVAGPHGQDAAMGWQAVAGMRFRMVGGYAVRPGAGGLANLDAPPDPLYQWATAADAGRDRTPAQRAQALAQARAVGIRFVLVPDRVPGSAELVRRTSQLLGSAPRRVQDVEIWTL